LLAAILSVAALTAVGCSNTSTTGGTGTPTTPVTVAAAGTYTFTITGIATGGQVHSARVTVTVP
jgi:hypothetical protein